MLRIPHCVDNRRTVNCEIPVLTVQFAPHRKHTPSPQIKDIPVKGRGDVYGCEMLKIAHFLDNLFTDPATLYPEKLYYFYVSGTYFC
jgi:hypothetical protein